MGHTLDAERRRTVLPRAEVVRSKLRRRLKHLAYGALAVVALIAAGRAIAHNPTCSSEQASGSGWAFRADQERNSPLAVCYQAVPRQYLANWDTAAKVAVTNTSDRAVEVAVDWRLRTDETLTDASTPRRVEPGQRVKYSTALRVADTDGETSMRVRVFADGERTYRAVASAATRGLLEAYLGWLVVAVILIGLATWVLLGPDHPRPDPADDDGLDLDLRLDDYVWPRA